jgi:serine/threonine protein kinase
VYALGVVAYQCLAGRRPFDGGSAMEIATRHVRELPPPLPRDVPRPAGEVVDRAMAKKAADRYPNAAAFAEDARRVAVLLGATGPLRAA